MNNGLLLQLVMALFLSVQFVCILVLLVAAFITLDRTRRIPVVEERLQTVEEYLAGLSEEVNIGMGEGQGMEGAPMVFRSLDGKHTAGSLEELMEKMANDPDSGIDGQDVEALREFFRKIIAEESEDDEEGEEGEE